MTRDARARLDWIVAFYRSYGFTLAVTSTDRTRAQQDELLRRGKTTLPGGSSLHNFGRAADVVPRNWGVPALDAYRHIAQLARLVGVEPVIESDHVHLEFPR